VAVGTTARAFLLELLSRARYRPLSARQIPERSDFPSAVFGAGALRLSVPAGSRRVPGNGIVSHCAAAGWAKDDPSLKEPNLR